MMTDQNLEAYASTLSTRDFKRIQAYLYDISGIHLSDAKITLVSSRLSTCMRRLGLTDFGQYFDYVIDKRNDDEKTHFINALTTNETYFFREPQHFVFLENLIKQHPNKKTWRIWSGASSSGEEVYTIAMVLADALGTHSDWRVLGTDLSTKVLNLASQGHYPLERNEGIDIQRLKKYCLRGTGPQKGSFLMDPAIQKHCEFSQQNLMASCDSLGLFDVIFLRNVMIYFNTESKQKVLNNVLHQLKLGGYFMISHTESLFKMQHTLEQIQPSVYRKMEHADGSTVKAEDN